MATALIDGDIVAYMAASLAQDEQFPPLEGHDQAPPAADKKKAMRVARDIMDKWEHCAGCTSRRVALTDRSTPRSSFRYSLHPHYKNQRVSAKPVLLDFMNDYLTDRHFAHYIPRLEGDDVLSIWQTERPDSDDVIVSKDKDMLTVPGRVLIVPHMKSINDAKVVEVSKAEAYDRLFIQVLTGDPVDNYLGAPGVGQIKSRHWLKVLDDDPSMGRWNTIVRAFTEAWERFPAKRKCWVHPGDPGTEALMNMRCARLLSHKDHKDGKIGLWMPGDKREWI